jgi:hypothetical protein
MALEQWKQAQKAVRNLCEGMCQDFLNCPGKTIVRTLCAELDESFKMPVSRSAIILAAVVRPTFVSMITSWSVWAYWRLG